MKHLETRTIVPQLLCAALAMGMSGDNPRHDVARQRNNSRARTVSVANRADARRREVAGVPQGSFAGRSVWGIDTDTPPPADFPKLRIIINRVSHAEMRDACAKYTPWYISPAGCAEFFFGKGECRVTLSADFPDTKVEEHELAHCVGYDHPGSTTVREVWERHKSRSANK